MSYSVLLPVNFFKCCKDFMLPFPLVFLLKAHRSEAGLLLSCVPFG